MLSPSQELPVCMYAEEPILITPSSSTPNHTLYLSNLDDQKFLRFSIKYLYVYKKSVSMDILKNSLSRILVYYYPLAGRLRKSRRQADDDDDDDHKLEVDCNGEGAVFVEAFMDLCADEFLQFSNKPNKSWRKLLFRVEAQSFIDIPPLVVQIMLPWIIFSIFVVILIIALVAKDKAGKGKSQNKGGSKKGKGKGKGKDKEKKGSRKKVNMKKGKNRSTSGHRLLDENEDDLRLSGDEGGPSKETERRVSKPRSHSSGLYGGPIPKEPYRINISRGHIHNDTAMKTILGIMRAHWPIGYYQFREVEEKFPDWMDTIIEEFSLYYRHLRGQSRSEARQSLEMHIKATCKRLMNEEKRRTARKAKERGLSWKEVKPEYFSDLFWDCLLKFWNSEGHIHRSSVGMANRKKVVTLHSAGARSFSRVEQMMTLELEGEKPPQLDVWNRTHTRVGSRSDAPEYTTPEAMAIASRYAEILDRMPVEITLTGQRDEPIEWWMQATLNGASKPKKNRLIGYPRIPANQLIPNLAQRYRDSRRGGAGSSSSPNQPSSAIPDPIFMEVVRNVVEEVRANPNNFRRQLSNDELSTFARTTLEVADPESRLQWNNVLGEEMVRIVGAVLDDIVQKYETRLKVENDKEKEEEADFTDVEEGDNSDGEGTEIEKDEGEKGDDEDHENDDTSSIDLEGV